MSSYFSGLNAPVNRSISAVASSSSSFGDLALAGRELVRRPDLVVEEHLLQRDHAVAHAQAAEVLALAHHVLADRGEAGLLHRLAHQRVHLLGALLRAEEVGAVEVDRIDLLVGDEVGDVDRLDALGLDGREVLVGEDDGLSFLVSKALTISSSGTSFSSFLQNFW